MKYFLVNQATYLQEKEEGCIWAPKYAKNGKEIWHWNTLCEVEQGDIIFNNYKGKIVAVSIAQGRAYASVKPIRDLSSSWSEDGRRVDLVYFELSKPLDFHRYRKQIDQYRTSKYYPFTAHYQASQTYLTQLPNELSQFFISKLDQSDLEQIFGNLENARIEMEELEETQILEDIYKGRIRSYTDEELSKMEKKSFRYEAPSSRIFNHPREHTDSKLLATRLERANYQCEVKWILHIKRFLVLMKVICLWKVTILFP